MRIADLTRSEDVALVIARAASVGCGHLAGLLRPVMRGEMNMIVPVRATVMPPLHRLGKQGRPIVALVGDDDYRPPGPSGWTCAAKLRSWAAYAIVHGAGAAPEHYALAAALTVLHRRLLMIETTSVAAQEWAGFLRKRPDLPFMGVLPNDGPHPVTPPREHVH